MIDNVPLIQNANDVQQINASIIAMKKASRELDEKIVKLNSLNSELDKKIALLDSGLNKEIEDRKEAINSLDVASVGGSGKYISAISESDGKISATVSDITSTVSSGNSQPVTSGGVAEAKYTNVFAKNLSVSGWYKIATFSRRNRGSSISIELGTGYYYQFNSSHKIQINHGWAKSSVFDFAQDEQTVFDKIRICWNLNDVDYMGIYVHYTPNAQNPVYLNINACTERFIPVNFETDSLTWENTLEYNLGSSGLYLNGNQINPTDKIKAGSLVPITSGGVANSFSYIQGEIETGGTWIDGKKIYRRVADFTTSEIPSGNSNYTLSSAFWSNMDSIISIRILRPKYGTLNFAEISLPTRFDIPNKTLYVYNSPASWSGPFLLVFEYTKP